MLPGQHDSVAESALPGQQPGSEFGRYRLQECLGQGAMGAVYKAHDTQLDRVVAIKIPKFDTATGPDLLERFYREARSAATLSHAGICPVHDVGEIDGTHYISMGYIEGRPLTSFIRPDKPLQIKQAVNVVRKLAAALDEAHQHGVVHRDLKPDNVMVDKRSNPVIMDFGLAYRTASAGDSRMTQGGQIIGTPAYMSPEQVDADVEVMGPRSDVYSLGIILYELVTGHVPYEGSVARVLAQVIQGNPKPPSEWRSSLRPELEAICLKMMAANPDDRYASMADVSKALTAYLKRQPASDDSVAEATATVPAVTKPAPRPRIQTDTPAASRKRKQGLPVWGIRAAAVVVGLVLIAAITISVRVGDQTVHLEIDDPDAVVLVDGDVVRIENLGATIELKPGEHGVQVRRGDISVLTRSFTVFDGKNPVLKLEVLEDEPEPEAVVAAESVVTPPEPDVSTVPAVPVESASVMLVCERMESKRAAIGAHASTRPFQGPPGDGRRGANGLLIESSPQGWREFGTEYRCMYQRSGHSRFLQMWHPWQDGVVLVTVRDAYVNVYPGGVWGGYGGSRANYPFEKTEAYDRVFPIAHGQSVTVGSRMFADGTYELHIDDELVLHTTIKAAKPLEFSDAFQGEDLIGPMPAGTAAVMVGPTDSGSAIAEHIELTLLKGQSPAVAVVATPDVVPAVPVTATSPVSNPTTPAPSKSADGSTVTKVAVSPDGFTLDTPAKDVVSVWELHGAKTSERVALFKDGSTNVKHAWKPVSNGRIEFADGAGNVLTNGQFLLGQWRRGACLLMKRISPFWIAGTTDPVPLPEPAEDRNESFEENLLATFELTATNRRASQEFILPVTFLKDYRLMDRQRTIGTWSSDGTKLTVSFLDGQLGTASLSPRSKDELRGLSKTESGSAWALGLQRVQQVAVWETDRYGNITLFSNGRLNDPTGAESPGFWWMEGPKMYINHFVCTPSADGRSFKGVGQHSIGLNGKFVAGASN